MAYLQIFALAGCIKPVGSNEDCSRLWYVLQETPDKLCDRQRQKLSFASSYVECHALVVDFDDAAIGNRPPTQVSCEVGEDSFAMLVFFLDAHVPLFAPEFFHKLAQLVFVYAGW